jgi:hypothetical protein
MSESTTRKSIGVVILLAFITFTFWYVEAGNFSDSKMSGTYILQRGGEMSTLILGLDHNFHQELNRSGTVSRAEGSWRVSGEGHIAFSKEFLKVSGEEMSPAGQAYGQIENWFGLVSITLAPNPDGPAFRKKRFH